MYKSQALVISLLVSGAPLFCQTVLTTVTDTVYDGAGQRITGQCVYRLASGRATGAAGAQVSGEPVTVKFTSGNFSAPIVPTDTMLPSGQYYAVTCTGPRGWSKSGNWIVATSGTPLKWSDIWAATLPPPGILLPPAQLDATGLGPGTYCLNVAIDGTKTWAACAGTTALCWGTLTNSGWTGMTNSQWTGLTNCAGSALSWNSLTNSDWTGMTNSQWTGLTN